MLGTRRGNETPVPCAGHTLLSSTRLFPRAPCSLSYAPFQKPCVAPQCLLLTLKVFPKAPSSPPPTHLAQCPSTHFALSQTQPCSVPCTPCSGPLSAMAPGVMIIYRQCVCAPRRLCLMMSAAVCQWLYEMKCMCVHVRGHGAGWVLLGS